MLYLILLGPMPSIIILIILSSRLMILTLKPSLVNWAMPPNKNMPSKFDKLWIYTTMPYGRYGKPV